MIVPELIDLLGNSGQRLFPTSLPLVDGAAAISAKYVREPVNLHLVQAVSYRPLDNGRGELDLVVLGEPGRLAELFGQRLLFGLSRSRRARLFFGLLGFL